MWKIKHTVHNKILDMNIPYKCVKGVSNGEGLTIWNDKYNCKTEFWKGVITNSDKMVVARSYQAATTIVGESVDEDLFYVPLYEATILRFFRYRGQPMISTHRNINIAVTTSRIGTGRPFIELVNEAIENWTKLYRPYEHMGEKAIAYTPNTWEDLCMEEWCHVFLLIDVSTTKTNLVDTTKFNGPQLIYAMSLQANTPAMTPYPTHPIRAILPTSGNNLFHNGDEEVYHFISWVIPTLPVLTPSQANDLLRNGGAVVGFKEETPDITTKFLSPIYKRKWDLANETINPVHRWHELMDQSEEVAREYLLYLPPALSYMNEEYMKAKAEEYLNETAALITNHIVNILYNQYSPMAKPLYDKVSDIITRIVQTFKNKYKKTRPSRENLYKQVYTVVTKDISELPYSTQHSVHSDVNRVMLGAI